MAGLSGCSGPDEALTQMKIMYSEFFKTHARILEVHEVYHAATREGTLREHSVRLHSCAQDYLQVCVINSHPTISPSFH